MAPAKTEAYDLIVRSTQSTGPEGVTSVEVLRALQDKSQAINIVDQLKKVENFFIIFCADYYKESEYFERLDREVSAGVTYPMRFLSGKFDREYLAPDRKPSTDEIYEPRDLQYVIQRLSYLTELYQIRFDFNDSFFTLLNCNSPSIRRAAATYHSKFAEYPIESQPVLSFVFSALQRETDELAKIEQVKAIGAYRSRGAHILKELMRQFLQATSSVLLKECVSKAIMLSASVSQLPNGSIDALLSEENETINMNAAYLIYSSNEAGALNDALNHLAHNNRFVRMAIFNYVQNVGMKGSEYIRCAVALMRRVRQLTWSDESDRLEIRRIIGILEPATEKLSVPQFDETVHGLQFSPIAPQMSLEDAVFNLCQFDIEIDQPEQATYMSEDDIIIINSSAVELLTGMNLESGLNLDIIHFMSLIYIVILKKYAQNPSPGKREFLELTLRLLEKSYGNVGGKRDLINVKGRSIFSILRDQLINIQDNNVECEREQLALAAEDFMRGLRSASVGEIEDGW